MGIRCQGWPKEVSFPPSRTQMQNVHYRFGLKRGRPVVRGSKRPLTLVRFFFDLAKVSYVGHNGKLRFFVDIKSRLAKEKDIKLY